MALTWGQFKQCVEAQGVEDTDQLWIIDVDPDCTITVVRDSQDGAWSILDTGQASTLEHPR